ncbi:DUF6352 family protein [Chthonobacter rhizosphaerae]|uniref:DUF6352 family protein n=1 Tax=Chthonobacter rhizosphaerae TaxID=2735553 RepID=UPI0015EECDB7|nr:DUF6352 family protein [Chthonobacter rhizosphaerae]
MSGDFWVSSGHHLLERSAGGGLMVTDDFLKLYLARPEVVPPEDACAAERTLHARLMAEPRLAVDPDWVEAIADPDARENWRHLLAFRARLLAHPTLEAVYLDLVRGAAAGATPPIFLQQLVHVILRNALDREHDPFVIRAAELFFRPQRMTIHEGRLLLADEERVGDPRPAAHGSPLTALFEDASARSLDVLGPETVDGYKARSDAFDTVIDFRLGGEARAGFARVMEIWIGHMLALPVRIEPVPRIEGTLAWYVGLDAEATLIGDAAWSGRPLGEAEAGRVVALFRMDILDRERVEDRVAGEPVVLILAAGADRVVRVKPQNLIAGLPLKDRPSS